jgi:hypothetical protein
MGLLLSLSACCGGYFKNTSTLIEVLWKKKGNLYKQLRDDFDDCSDYVIKNRPHKDKVDKDRDLKETCMIQKGYRFTGNVEPGRDDYCYCYGRNGSACKSIGR